MPLADETQRLPRWHQQQQNRCRRGIRQSLRKARRPSGFYYCSWDNHNVFGSQTPTHTAAWERTQLGLVPDTQLAFTSRAYMDFQSAQIEKLLTQYGPIGDVWIDILSVLPRFYRQELFEVDPEIRTRG